MTSTTTRTTASPLRRSERRRSPLSRWGALVATGALLAAGVASAAPANAAPAAASSEVDSWVVPQLQTEAATDYWTPERMQAATPGDVLIADQVAAADAAAVDPAAVDANASVEKGAPTTIDAAPSPVLRATRAAPVPTIGKVFFTLGGLDYVCSANSVRSTNGNTVSTAGHCLNEGPGAYATRFVFAPAYENGSTPYGTWAATRLVAPSQWTSSGDITYDTGFAVVASKNGRTLAQTVGASGVSFNQSTGLNYTAYGYPAAAPFTGETLQSCAGTATPDPFGQSASQGIPCDMTGGSSGGPWFIGSGSGGIQNSVNSFGYNSVANTMFGPYWGSVIQSAYTAAQG